MSQPKRVRDSKKRAVRQGKEQVWLVNWEKVVNTNHWFKEATWTDVVYDSSWETAQEPLQVYDKGWEEVGWWGSWVTLTGLNVDYLEVYNGSANSLRASYTPANWDASNITLSSDNEYVSVSGRAAGPWDYYIQVNAHSDDAYATISVSDGTNTFYLGVQCIPYVNVESIGNPTPSEISIAPNTDKYVELNYSPSDATSPGGEVACETINSNLLGYWGTNWVLRSQIGYYGADVDGQVNYYLNSDQENVKTVTVHNVTPSVWIESLTWVPQTVQQLAPWSFRSFSVTYWPSDADYIEAQIWIIPDDAWIANAYISEVDTTNHTFRLDYYWASEWTTYINFVVNGTLLTSTEVTIQNPPLSSISNLQYETPEVVEDVVVWGIVVGQGTHNWAVTFSYSPSKADTSAITISQTWWTRVDWSSIQDESYADVSVSYDGITYENGTAYVTFYVDAESLPFQRGEFRIQNTNDENNYLDVKITYWEWE